MDKQREPAGTQGFEGPSGTEQEGRLGREAADDLLTVLQAFERVVRWGFRAHQHPDDPGPGAQATLFYLMRHQPARAREIADWLGVGAAPVSRQLADLEAQGLVTRSPDPDDARAAQTSLTDAGQDAVQDLRGRRVTVLQQALGGLSDEQVRSFIHAMESMVDEFRRGLSALGPATGTLAHVPQASGRTPADTARPGSPARDDTTTTDPETDDEPA